MGILIWKERWWNQFLPFSDLYETRDSFEYNKNHTLAKFNRAMLMHDIRMKPAVLTICVSAGRNNGHVADIYKLYMM